MSLAFVGDAVFELMVRERLLENGTMPARKLHLLAVKKVSASAQALAYDALDAALNDRERSILRRGRNANTARVPKSATPADYRKATALETLFGFLHLNGESDRLQTLFDLVWSVISERG